MEYWDQRTLTAKSSHKSFRDNAGSSLRRKEMNLRKKSLSSDVNLFPRPLCDTTLVGGVGEREGGIGILISALGGGKLWSNAGVCVVRLLIVLRRRLGGIGTGGGGDSVRRDLVAGRALRLGGAEAGEGRGGDGSARKESCDKPLGTAGEGSSETIFLSILCLCSR